MNKVIRNTAVIIPAHNEAAMIGEVVKAARKLFSLVIVVDDGSSDATAALARMAGAEVLTHVFGQGVGCATRTGIEYALRLPRVKYFATIDADGQHRAADLVRMRRQLIKSGDDIVIGSRFMPGGETENMPPLKRRLLRLAVKFSNWTSRTRFTDTHNGIRIFNRHVASTINIEESGYQFCSEILEKIVQHDYKYSECPVRVIYTEYSKAKGQPMLNAVNIGVDVLSRKLFRR